jgi:hypothetical protein
MEQIRHGIDENDRGFYPLARLAQSLRPETDCEGVVQIGRCLDDWQTCKIGSTKPTPSKRGA